MAGAEGPAGPERHGAREAGMVSPGGTTEAVSGLPRLQNAKRATLV